MSMPNVRAHQTRRARDHGSVPASSARECGADAAPGRAESDLDASPRSGSGSLPSSAQSLPKPNAERNSTHNSDCSSGSEEDEDEDVAAARGGVGRHGKNRREAIAMLLPKVGKYLRQHHRAAAVSAADDMAKVLLVREAVLHYANRKRKYIVWGEGESKAYRSRYSTERAIVNLYWERLLDVVLKRQRDGARGE